MLVAPTYMGSSSAQYQMLPGDVLNTNEQPQNISNAAGITYTGQQIAAGDIYRTTVGAGQTDTLPTAAQLILALQGSTNIVTPPGNELYGVQPNRIVQLAWPANVMPFNVFSSFRRMISNQAANAITMAVPASSGMSFGAAPFGTNVNIGASAWREYLFQIMNSSPSVLLAVSQTNASNLLTVPNQPNLDMVNNVTPGMSVFGTNIAANSVVQAVQRDTGVITLNNNVTATIAINGVTFTPTVVVYGLRSGTL